MALLLGITALGLCLGVFWTFWREGSAAQRTIDAPMPLEIAGREEFERLLLGLKSYQYRAAPRGSSSSREIYYDTQGWDLARRGYSYRFTRQVNEDGTLVYSLRTLGDENEGQPFEIVSELPPAIGESIAGDAWERALTSSLELPAARRLRALLTALGIAESDVAARGVGDIRLEHFDLRDKGRTWFELDYEEWAFAALGIDADGGEPFRWYGIALRKGEGPEDEEFRERVRQMERVLPTFYRFRVQREPRLSRALEALGLRI